MTLKECYDSKNMYESFANLNKFKESKNKEFRRIFGKSLDNYWLAIYSFDIIKFNEDFTPPEGKSLSDHVKDEFGEQAVSLIKELIGLED